MSLSRAQAARQNQLARQLLDQIERDAVANGTYEPGISADDRRASNIANALLRVGIAYDREIIAEQGDAGLIKTSIDQAIAYAETLGKLISALPPKLVLDVVGRVCARILTTATGRAAVVHTRDPLAASHRSTH